MPQSFFEVREQHIAVWMLCRAAVSRFSSEEPIVAGCKTMFGTLCRPGFMVYERANESDAPERHFIVAEHWLSGSLGRNHS